MTYTIDEEDYLAHYGILRRSGRYPWGSGGNVESRSRSFLDMVTELEKQGLTFKEIVEGLDLRDDRGRPWTSTDLRRAKSMAKAEVKAADIAFAQRLKEKGMANTAIAERMGRNESSVRALLKAGEQDKEDVTKSTANMIRAEVEAKGYIDIGAGVERHVGLSREKLNTAVAYLKDEGYEVYYDKVQQLGTDHETSIKVIAPPGSTWSEFHQNIDQVQQLGSITQDGGRTYTKTPPPMPIDSKRVAVRYGDEGGADADGVVYIRRGVDDVSLGAANYAQVRINVDGTHYIKGMAMYSDDMPPGVDLVFNTNKKNTGNKLDALKPLSDDPDLPFGSITRPLLDNNGNVKSVMNIVNDEGTWDEWSKNLSSQMLSKQSLQLARQQLDAAYQARKADLDEINSLTNPVVKQRLLQSYADGADTAAVHLKAAAMPRQATKVILPINSLKDTEVYAPTFRDGEAVVLIRYPHGGIFEIPELRVNNKHPQAKKALGNAQDAIGINAKVAAKLSGADFDGDTVLVIPNNSGAVKTKASLQSLKGFEPQRAYPAYDGMKTIDGGVYNASTGKVEYGDKKPNPRGKGMQMGLVSNLITDMTIQGASDRELAQAVRHSMVVIDAEKHKLNYKQSELDNNIPSLRKKYQGGRAQGGASTLVSRRKSTIEVNQRKQGYKIDPATGKKIYSETGKNWVNKKGETVYAKQRVKALLETDDAHTLSSGTAMEKVYADHANRMKALANEARKTMVNTKPTPRSASARAAYKNEVDTLTSKLNTALQNAPRERQAQIIGNAIYKAKVDANPSMEASEKKKLRSLALSEARARTGAKKELIKITDSEWEAIQAGAISPSMLKDILDNTDVEQVRQRAMPRQKLLMDASKTSRARALLAAGATQAQVADQLGVSLTTLKDSL